MQMLRSDQAMLTSPSHLLVAPTSMPTTGDSSTAMIHGTLDATD